MMQHIIPILFDVDCILATIDMFAVGYIFRADSQQILM